MRYKKGFSVNQMFVFMASLIIMALVLFFGVRSIGVFTQKSCDIEMTDFVRSMSSQIDDISNRYSSRMVFESSLPCSANTLCVVSPNNGDTQSAERRSLLERDVSPFIAEEYGEGSTNIFLLEGNSLVHGFTLQNIVVDTPGYFCVESRRVRLALDGVGRATKVSLWTG